MFSLAVRVKTLTVDSSVALKVAFEVASLRR